MKGQLGGGVRLGALQRRSVVAFVAAILVGSGFAAPLLWLPETPAGAAVTSGPSPLLSSDLQYQVSSSNDLVTGWRVSADGQSAFFAVYVPSYTGTVISGLYRRDLTTNQQTLMVPLPGYSKDSFPIGTFSGDGAFYAGFSNSVGLVLIDTASGAQRILDPGYSNAPLLWSDDHRFLFYSTSGFYRYDTSTGTSEPAAPTTDGNPPNAGGSGGEPTISADGNRVAFSTSATNMTTDQINGQRVFVHDFTTGQTTLVPQPHGQPSTYFDRTPIISADGTALAFEAQFQSNGAVQIAVATLSSGAVALASAPPSGSTTDGETYLAAISGNGDTVVFNSTATDLVPGTSVAPSPIDAGLAYEYPLFARIVSKGQTVLLTRSTNGPYSANGGATDPTIERSGETVAFRSYATDLVPYYQQSPGPNNLDQVYTYDLTTNNITLASAQPPGSSTGSASESYAPVISATGEHVLYQTTPTRPMLVTVNGAPTPPPPCPTGISRLASGEPWAVAAMSAPMYGKQCAGYWVVTTTGGVTSIGAAPWLGDMSGHHLNAAMIGIAATPDGNGYDLLGADGGIFSFGDARFYGSTGGSKLNKPVVGMSMTPSGGGYWLVASDGGIFTFGNAAFYGSTGALRLNKPVVGMATTTAGTGYWLVASDGGIFSFNAPFYGSMGAQRLNQPVVGMTAQPDGGGYRMVATDGGVFDFGDAVYYGSLPGERVQNPQVTTMASSVDGKGYYLINATGTVWAFGDAPYLGNA